MSFSSTDLLNISNREYANICRAERVKARDIRRKEQIVSDAWDGVYKAFRKWGLPRPSVFCVARIVDSPTATIITEGVFDWVVIIDRKGLFVNARKNQISYASYQTYIQKPSA